MLWAVAGVLEKPSGRCRITWGHSVSVLLYIPRRVTLDIKRSGRQMTQRLCCHRSSNAEFRAVSGAGNSASMLERSQAAEHTQRGHPQAYVDPPWALLIAVAVLHYSNLGRRSPTACRLSWPARGALMVTHICINRCTPGHEPMRAYACPPCLCEYARRFEGAAGQPVANATCMPPEPAHYPLGRGALTPNASAPGAAAPVFIATHTAAGSPDRQH